MTTQKNTDTKLYGPNQKVEDQIEKESDITPEEKKLLDDSEQSSAEEDDLQLTNAALDNTDEDGEPLNEKGFGEDYSGEDLDVPGTDEDDDDEAIGEEDEENNDYSEADTE
ncbi:MAG: hypothetical protein WDM71_03810 [Ferruginibacter sp.]